MSYLTFSSITGDDAVGFDMAYTLSRILYMVKDVRKNGTRENH